MVNFGKCIKDPAQEKNALIDEVTRAFLEANPNLSQESDKEIVKVYMDMLRENFVEWNTAWGTVDTKKADAKGLFVIRASGGWGGIMYDKTIPITAVANILAAKYQFVKINLTDMDGIEPSKCELAVYQTSGVDEGIYSIDDDYKLSLIRNYISDCDDKIYGKIESIIKLKAPVVTKTKDRDLIPVNNGIFNLKTKQLMPFSPEYVFTYKCRVDYNPQATNKTFTDSFGTWDFESWILDIMSDVDDDKRALLYSMLFAIKPNTLEYKHMLWVSVGDGNSGKGTLAKVIMSILGQKAIKHLTLSAMLKDSRMLADLPYRTLILGLDNTFKEYLDKDSEIIKLLATDEAITVDRKFRSDITFTFKGSDLQLMNYWPKLADKSDSMMRRWWAIQFKKNFTGKENKAIKVDYLTDKDVLEYILKRLLELDYTEELPETENTQHALRQIMETNNPLYDFVNDIIANLPPHWKCYPRQALYYIYQAWYKRQGYEKFSQKLAGFTLDLQQALNHTEGWTYNASKQFNSTTDEVKRDYIDIPVWEIIQDYTPDGFWSNKCNDWVNLPVSGNTGKIKSCFTGCIVRAS